VLYLFSSLDFGTESIGMVSYATDKNKT